MRMLAKNPADRWPSLGDVVQRLGGGSRRAREHSATAAALARDEPALAVDPAAVAANVPSTLRAAAAIATTTPKPTPTPSSRAVHHAPGSGGRNRPVLAAARVGLERRTDRLRADRMAE